MRHCLQHIFAACAVTYLAGCGGGGGSGGGDTDTTPVQLESGLPLQGVVTISYPQRYSQAIEVNQISQSGVGVLSLASDESAPSGQSAFCAAGYSFTLNDRETVIAEGLASAETSIPISQQNITVNGRGAVEFLYIDLPDPDNDEDNTPLTALGHQYYFPATATSFEENIEVFAVCFSTENGFPNHEPVFRTILNSVVIQ